MNLRRKRQAQSAQSVQLRTAGHHPFSALDGYVPLRRGEIEIYRAIREAVPLVDAAIVKIIRLVGGFTVACGNKEAQRGLEAFLRTVPVGRAQRGIDQFMEQYLDSLLTCGRAVGEIVPRPDGADIAAVLCGDITEVEVREGASPLEFAICGWDGQGCMAPLPRQNLLLFTPFRPEANNPYGVSLLRSMPFVTELLLKIYHALGQNWERIGNAHFAVIYRPQSGETELVQRVLFKLTARREGFPFIPELGSELYRLGRASAHGRNSAAEQYVRQALGDETELEITGVSLEDADDGLYKLSVRLQYNGQNIDLSLTVQ